MYEYSVTAPRISACAPSNFPVPAAAAGFARGEAWSACSVWMSMMALRSSTTKRPEFTRAVVSISVRPVPKSVGGGMLTVVVCTTVLEETEVAWVAIAFTSMSITPRRRFGPL